MYYDMRSMRSPRLLAYNGAKAICVPTGAAPSQLNARQRASTIFLVTVEPFAVTR